MEKLQQIGVTGPHELKLMISGFTVKIENFLIPNEKLLRKSPVSF
jgi:hypothetical protein